ncbi:uncharacterized protein cubi_01112 [Cryptosporidium ubiquitum]|uniref:Uncharacterized protein n=1 Tax=Cryptosporidium ubiquitum TaxID=857276 RepID=A0A1J4MMM8_9CRYT|nr:uncharacterized protein cubi_01112 [Cryptosporidium ubiquitum]OII74268.1 hypothetical protein cubi_01112 [Cryptosporidium ubiquitum]
MLTDLSNRYLYKYPCAKGTAINVIREVGSSLEIDLEDGDIKEKMDSIDSTNRIISCSLILLLIAFENERNLKKKLLNFLRNFMQESKAIWPNISDYTQFVYKSFNNLVNFVVENMVKDIKKFFFSDELDLVSIQKNQLLIEKYTSAVQFVLNNLFEMLLSSAGVNNRLTMRSDYVLPILFEGICHLDSEFKRILIYILHIQTSDFNNQIKLLINETNMKRTINCCVEIDQQLLLCIISILNRISSIVICCSNSFSSLINYIRILFKTNILDELEPGKVPKKVIHTIFFRILCSNTLEKFNKDLITSIGMFSSLLYISEQITQEGSTTNDLYLNKMNKIVENVQEHVEKWEFSNVCQIAFYRGLTVYCSMINDIERLNNQICDYKIFKISFRVLAYLINNCKSEEDSAYGLQSLLIWISRFKSEISNSNKILIKTSIPCFNLITISDILFSFLDQPIIYCSKLASQILEEFVDYLLVLDSIFERETIEEINLDPLNWFMNFLFNNNSNNSKFQLLSLYILFNGILNHSKSGKFKEQSYKLNKVINLSLDRLEFSKLDGDFMEIQLIYYLAYSLSINNISSSSHNLILAWFNLRRVLLEEKNTNESKDNLFLDFIFFFSIQIIKRDIVNGHFDKKEVINSEGKSNMFSKLLQILKKADRKYYYEKLPLIFDSFFEGISNIDHSYCMGLNFIQIQILVDLKRNGFLFWEDELEVGDHLINSLSLLVIFNNSTKTPNCRIHGSYLIKSLTSNDSISLSHILELLSLSIKSSEIKKFSSVSKYLLHEMECLYIIICNVKPLNICSGVLSRTISIFGQFFVLIKKILLRKDISLVFKDKYSAWISKIFNYLRTSIGLQVSSDKVGLYLPIFRIFLETFYCEDLNGNLFEHNLNLKKNIFKSVMLSLHSQLFSPSNECRNLVSDLLFFNPKFDLILDEFHSDIIETRNLHSFNPALMIIKKLFKKIRPREYFASNILFYYYLRKIYNNLEDQRESLIILFKSLFNLLNFEINEKLDNIYFLISEIIFWELIRRIQDFCSSDLDVNILIFGSNNIPLQSVINLLGISFITEFIYNSANNYKPLCDNSLKIVYLSTLLLFILSDSKMVKSYLNKFYSESNEKINFSDGQFDKESLNYNSSRIIDEVSNLMKTILSRIGVSSIFYTSHKQLSLIPGYFKTFNLYLNSFIEHLNIVFISKINYNFIYKLCIIYINLIFKCEHPGDSENLLEIFSAILNTANLNLRESRLEKQSETRICNLPSTKIGISLNIETAQTFNDFILNKSHYNPNISKTSNSADSKSLPTKKLSDELPKNLLLHIIYSLLPLDGPKAEYNIMEFIDQGIGDFIVDYEQIDNIFFQFLEGNTKYRRDNSEFIASSSSDIDTLFSFGRNSTRNLGKLYIPSPKRKSNNLCKTINILVSIMIKDSKFHKSIKYVIKLLIIASLNIKIFHGVINKIDYDPDDIIFQYYTCIIHSNHILAALISKSKSGGGGNNLYEIFDLGLLIGSLFSALNNIKMYDFKVKDENGFNLCNSSLNLMSALLKRFSFKANGIESNIEYISKMNNQFKILNSEFTISTEHDQLSIFFNNVFKDVLSITLNKKFNSNYLYSLISDMNISTRFSLKSIKKISVIFEQCIIDILLNSTDSQFQGMILLLLTELCISWSDCSYELAICIIKSIYSDSYFVRMHSSKLLGEITLRTLSITDWNLNQQSKILNTNLDQSLFEILINISNSKYSKLFSLLNLIFQSIKFSIHNSDINKYNLIHGVLSLGIELLKKIKKKSSLASFEIESCSIYESLLVLVGDGFKNSFKHSLLRITSLKLISLLLELEFPVNEKFKCLENLIYYWKNDKSISNISYLKFHNLKEPFISIRQPKSFANENLSEPIYLIKTIVVNAFKYIDSEELNSLICLSPTSEKIIHPKILFEFYSSITDIIYNLPEVNEHNFVHAFFTSINNHLKTIRYLFLLNNETQTINVKITNRKKTILIDLVKVLIGCLSFIGFNKNLSHAFLNNKQSCSILESVLELITFNQELSEYRSYESLVTNIKNITDFNFINKINNFYIENQTSMLELSIFFVRFYKNMVKHYSIPHIIIFELEKIVFDNALKVVYKNVYDQPQTTLEKKYLICKIIQIIFESLEIELFSESKMEKNDRIKKLTYAKIDINDTNKSNILSLLCLNHDYWYNLMICLVYLMTDEAFQIENTTTSIFKSFEHVIRYFCNNFLQTNGILCDCKLNYLGNYSNIIEEIILLNDQDSCLFSVLILDAIFSNIESIKSKNSSVLFPMEIDNICNEYLNISQIATNQIFMYLAKMNQITLHLDKISKIESYFKLWEEQVKNEFNLFERVYNCIRDCPKELLCIELFGSILIDEIKILFFILSIKKLSIIIRYKNANNGGKIFENSTFDISLFEEYIDFLLSNVHEKKIEHSLTII